MANATPPQTAEPLVYRPLSGLALAGLICSGLYAALVLVSIAVGLVGRLSLMLPGWLVPLPIAGVVLSLLGLRQIRNSEGTRAGERLAGWGLWLGVLAGLGYGSYMYFTGLAIRQQADRFLTDKGGDGGFFPHLLAGDVNRAFLLTLPPRERRTANPADEKAMEVFDLPVSKNDFRGPLSHFRDWEVTRVLLQPSNPPVRVEAGAVRDWGHDKEGYRVERTYRIITAEAVHEIHVTVLGIDSEVPGEGRKWYVKWRPDQGLAQPRLSELGEKMMKVRGLAGTVAQRWLSKVSTQDSLAAFLDTLPPAERTRQEARAEWAKKCAGAAAAAAAVGRAAPLATAEPRAWAASVSGQDLARLILPGFEDFLQGRTVILAEKLRTDDPKLANALRSDIAHLWRMPPGPEGGLLGSPRLKEREYYLAHCEVKDGRMLVTFSPDLMVRMPGMPRGTSIGMITRLTVETDAGIDPNSKGALDRFRVVSFECLRAGMATAPGAPE